ncbi:MAG TPA: type II toxin-antitoxin system VapC family toxin [Pirellulales bacterium]|nr:type II toxin-antitoxin system VapC family toxin [Pirellulales bacterium]
MFLLDTDHIGVLQLGEGQEAKRLRSRMEGYAQHDFYFPIVSFHEQVVGWHTYANRARKSDGLVRAYRMFQGILTDFARHQVAPFDDLSAAQFDALRQQHLRIGTMDLRISAIALAHRYTLLSRNAVDFAKVPGLQVEDWTMA